MAVRKEMNATIGMPLIYAALLPIKIIVKGQIVGTSTIRTVPQRETMIIMILTVFYPTTNRTVFPDSTRVHSHPDTTETRLNIKTDT